MKAHPDFATRELPKVASLPARSAQHWEWFDSGCRFNGPSGCLGKSDLSRASSRLALWIVRHQVNGEISLLKLPNGPPIDAVLCATKDGCEFGILHLFNSASVSAREGEEAHPICYARALQCSRLCYSVGTISENGSAAVVVPRCRRGDSESDLS